MPRHRLSGLATVSRWRAKHDEVFAEDNLREFDAQIMTCMIHAGMWSLFTWFVLSVAQSFVWAVQ